MGTRLSNRQGTGMGTGGVVYSKAVGPFLKGTLQSPGESKSSFLLLRSRAGEVAQLVRALTYEDKDLSSGPGM